MFPREVTRIGCCHFFLQARRRSPNSKHHRRKPNTEIRAEYTAASCCPSARVLLLPTGSLLPVGCSAADGRRKENSALIRGNASGETEAFVRSVLGSECDRGDRYTGEDPSDFRRPEPWRLMAGAHTTGLQPSKDRCCLCIQLFDLPRTVRMRSRRKAGS